MATSESRKTDAVLTVVASFCALPAVEPSGPNGRSVGFRGGVTLWETRYAGGDSTGSAPLIVRAGAENSIIETYWGPREVEAFADLTEPRGEYEFVLSMEAFNGVARFAVVSVSAERDKKTPRHLTAAAERPVMTQFSPYAISVLWNAESASHLDLVPPAGSKWSEKLEGAIGLTLPPIQVAFSRGGDLAQKPPVVARAVGVDPKWLVAAHPMADLDSLLA